MKLDPRELATVLAALRNWQLTLENLGLCGPFTRDKLESAGAPFHDHFATAAPLSADRIDTLCERLNCEDKTPAREWIIMSPDGMPIHRDPYTSLDELAEAAANFPMRFLHQGFYRDGNGRHIDLAALPALLRVIECEPAEDDDDDDDDGEDGDDA